MRNDWDDSAVKSTCAWSISAVPGLRRPSPGTVTKWSSTRVESSEAWWTSMNPPPPGPVSGLSATQETNAAAMHASTALPPSRQHVRPRLCRQRMPRPHRASHARKGTGAAGAGVTIARDDPRASARARGSPLRGAAAALRCACSLARPTGDRPRRTRLPADLFVHDGFELWNNFWYAGRYSFVTYSLLYYPLAALLGIKLLAVATIATAALAFAVVLGREWGPTARWSSRTFAVVWAGIVLSAAFPFALGAALALLALWALQAGARARFGRARRADARRQPARLPPARADRRRRGDCALGRELRLLLGPALILLGAACCRARCCGALFPGEGRFPFPPVQGSPPRSASASSA